jgi:hypothetical protein
VTRIACALAANTIAAEIAAMTIAAAITAREGRITPALLMRPPLERPLPERPERTGIGKKMRRFTGADQSVGGAGFEPA